MKRFHFLLAAVLMLGITAAALAEMPTEKKVMKIEVSSIVDHASIGDMAIIHVLDLNYIAESSGEVISDFKPPSVIGKINDAYTTSLFKPPISANKTYLLPDLLPDIRRLSCASLVAASDRHT